MSIGSIFIKHNPVTAWESYVLNVAPAEKARHPIEAIFTDYAPEDRVDGGYWVASFKLHARSNLLKEMYENGLGRLVEAWGYGLQQDFEGQIYRMRYVLWPNEYVKSLENVLNKIHMRTDYDADGAVERTTELTNADSDARFGTKQLVLSGGETEGLSVADQAVQQFIDYRAWPSSAPNIGAAKSGEYIEIYCRGFIDTLNWTIYNQTVAEGTQGASAQLGDIIDANGEFIARQTFESNSTTVTKEYDSDRKPLDIASGIVGLGDSNNQRWILFMKGRSATQVVGRELVLKQASPAEIPS